MFKSIFSKPVKFDSVVYWENRYRSGGNSGAGSYDDSAVFKSRIVNAAIKDFGIHDVVEFGCGDGNQLSLYEIPAYVGLDVSPTIVQKCIDKFSGDQGKSFFLYHPNCFADQQGLFRSDAALSVDVLFHLVEKEIFEIYLTHLFASALRLVIIYAADEDIPVQTQYEFFRRFTPFIAR